MTTPGTDESRTTISCPAPCEVPAALTVEIDRLREALTMIADGNWNTRRGTDQSVREFARETLGGRP